MVIVKFLNAKPCANLLLLRHICTGFIFGKCFVFLGWTRELVYRATCLADGRRAADAYYRPPGGGKKLVCNLAALLIWGPL